jgi:integrase
MAKIRKSPSHLLRVGTVYHFRYSIPREYHRFVSGEIRVSLGTASLKVARLKAAKLTSLTQGYLASVAEGRIVIDKKNQIKAALGQFLRDMLEKHELGRLDGQTEPSIATTGGERVEPELMLTYVGFDISDQLKGRKGNGKLDVARFLEQAGLKDVPEDSLTYKYARRELLKICQAVIKIEQERLKGNYNSQLELSILNNYSVQQQPGPTNSEKPKRKRSTRLSKAILQFIKESVSDGKWAPKSIVEYENRLALLLEVMGDCLLSEIDFKKTRRFFDNLKCLPPNRSKIKAYRDKTIPQLLKMKLPKDKCMSVRTVNNAMQSVYGLFEWAVQRDMMDKNYAGGMRIKQTRRPDESKERFMVDDLKCLFGSMDKTAGHKFWIPLLGLYTGARLEEICQLYVADIRKEAGVWIIDINDKGEKQLKTHNAKRIVPIHEALLAHGFTEYVQQIESEGHERVFPKLKKMKGKFGHYFSRAFSTHLKKLGIKIEGRKVSFHSLRHTFITCAKHNDLPENHVKELVGHSIQSLTFGLYGKRYDISKLKEIIDQVTFEID